MAPITEEMLRRRSEHNEGILNSLEELVLQEEGITEIDKVLGSLCPNLKILYMPNNLIACLQNMHRLKQLQYLNLAVNNLEKIGGLQHCEALEKLDLTLNFINKNELASVTSLRANILLRDLFLTGNPCQDFAGYRNFVIASLPSLKRLDGLEIKPSERIVAQQEFQSVLDSILNREEAVVPEASAESVNDKGQIIRDYTPATRLAEHAELEGMKTKNSSDKENKQQKPPERRTGFDPLPTEGRVYQKNEGGWKFRLVESDCKGKLILDVAVGKYMETSVMDIDIQPLLVRVLIKGKLLQLKLPEEVKSGQSNAQRSTATGHLVITMPKLVPPSLRRTAPNIFSHVVSPVKGARAAKESSTQVVHHPLKPKPAAFDESVPPLE